ncbi:hypothetical protein ACIRL2_41440 [Embleya sp. NPDC127516]|uniref:hypothetical protein n=1 Tax=Embleya sp. NPDC127516 TaxID=3363990 RepID=UPI00380F0E41
MTSTPWHPLSVRLGHADFDDTLYEGVPDHLRDVLERWVHDTVNAARAEIIRMRLRIPAHPQMNDLYVLTSLNDFALLDVIDAALSEPHTVDHYARQALDTYLEVAGSAYHINAMRDGLEMRVDPTVTSAVRETVTEAANTTTAGSAAEHLTAAWTAVYGLDPDPSVSYSNSIKAVECAAHAVVQPNHTKATLGTMLGELKSVPHKFAFTVATGPDQIAVPRAMMQLLWDGQTSRHGKQTPTRPETLNEARVAVHTAATLVQWFVSGAITRLP